jgi:hypothetical protein
MSQRGVSPPEHKKMKRSVAGDGGEASDGERSDQDLVVDDANEAPLSGQNGNHHSPRENGGLTHDKQRSPRGSPGGGGGGSESSGGSSSGSAGKKRTSGDDTGGKKTVKSSSHNQAKPAHQQPGAPSLTGGQHNF